MRRPTVPSSTLARHLLGAALGLVVVILVLQGVSDFRRFQLAEMASKVETAHAMMVRAALMKDRGERNDVEAGMAKLLGARIAWAAADNALQIHGGNGFALEYEISRVLCDARILNIFEGAAEIQAQVIARRILDGAN